jgi:carboxypeptidase Taq
MQENMTWPSPAAQPNAAAPKKRHRASVESKLTKLRHRLREIADLHGAASVLGWDEATYMPAGGAPARGRQGALVRRLAHERSIDPALGRLIDALAPWAESLPPESADAALVQLARRDFEKARRVPADYVARANAHGSASFDAWKRARPANDFAVMAPLLEKTLDLSREYAEFFAPYEHVADPLIDDADEGMTTASVRALFSQLRLHLQPVVQAITEHPPLTDGCLRANFDRAAQLQFGRMVVERMGYDVERGRLDETHHPFCTRFSHGDVRITTRVFEDDFGQALFSTLHEAGHAMYEQGVDAAFDGTPLGRGVSAGVHESQSRLWENIIGRSRGFWQHFYPQLQRTFPTAFDQVPLETFYRAINKVERSLIRTDADEVTYNLHIMLRFDLELAMLEDRLRVKDLPEAWREAMRVELGVVPPDNRDGCLQDVHWYSGGVGGAFQSYAIGNILSAQFHAAALAAHPEIPTDIEAGKFATLHGWLCNNIYRHGRKYRPGELIERTTGTPMRIEPYIAYLRGKYGEIYELPPVSSRPSERGRVGKGAVQSLE